MPSDSFCVPMALNFRHELTGGCQRGHKSLFICVGYSRNSPGPNRRLHIPQGGGHRKEANILKLTTEQLEQRRANMAMRKAKREAAEAQRRAAMEKDKPLILEALRAVLTAPDATAAQRLYAVAVLDSMEGYSFIPYNVKYPGKGSSELIAEFARTLEASGHE